MMMHSLFTIEHAKSDRSHCKKCKRIIPKDAIRITRKVHPNQAANYSKHVVFTSNYDLKDGVDAIANVKCTSCRPNVNGLDSVHPKVRKNIYNMVNAAIHKWDMKCASVKLEMISKSPLKSKKWRAIWSDGTYTDFGASGYSDYTIHKDKKRRHAYRLRHAQDNLNDPKSPGALSWYILWGDSTNMEKCIRAFRKKFNV